jgi:hypothetical protein
MGFNLPLLNRRRRLGGGGGFSPAVLFSLAEPGVWYDPSDLTTLFTDTAGTTPVTAPGQTVALALDKSKGLTLGPELVTNGTFDSDTVWAKDGGATISGGVGNTTGASSRLRQDILTIGKFYQITVTVSNYVSGTPLIQYGAVSTSIPSANGTYTVRVQASGAALFGVRDAVCSWDNISVRELPGFHATQSILASRPTYAVVPATGRRNLLGFTEQFDNAAWSKTAVTATGGEVRETTSNSVHSVSQNVSLTGTHTFSLELQAVGRDVYTIWMGTSSLTFAFTYTFSTNNLVVLGTALSNVTATVLSGGWVRFTGNVVTPNRFQISIGAANATYVGDPATGFNIRNAQLETGSTATNYQRVGNAFDVTEAGVQSLSYLSFDGIDDFLITPTITPGVDKVQVFAGVRKLSDAARGMIAEYGDGGVGTVSYIYLDAPNTGSRQRFAVRANSGTQVNALGASVSAPVSFVLTGTSDLAAPLTQLRRNGAVDASSTDASGATLTNHALFIGRRAGTSLPFNGHIYSLIVRFGANLDAATITSTETWAGGKTGLNWANIISPTVFARDETAILDRFDQIIERRAS